LEENQPIVILGVDPGLASTGVGVIRQNGARGWQALHHAFVTTNERQPLPVRLERIYHLVAEAIDAWRPQYLSIESVFFARNVRSAVLMAHGRGAALLAAAHRRINIAEYAPTAIKQSVVGKGRASKEQVQLMIASQLGISSGEPLSEHEADALAAALCHAYRGVTPLARQVGRASGSPDSRGDAAYEARKAMLAKARGGRRRQ
jgi:crossover junction endodeoxyribonuclease RuvC